MRPGRLRVSLFAALLALPLAAHAQGIDLSRGGPVDITATDGIEWRQAEQVVIARGDARAVRGNVTVDANRLLARYRPRPQAGQAENKQPAATPPAVGSGPGRADRLAAAARSGGWRPKARSASPPPPMSPVATARSTTWTRRCWC